MLALRILLAPVLASAAVAGCAASPSDDLGPPDGGDGKFDGKPNVAWSPNIANIVPEPIHAYLEKYQWGDWHALFQMTHRWYALGDLGRAWLRRVSEGSADAQEGEPGNGLDFLAMHRALIVSLRDRWGDEAVDNNEDGRQTFSAVLDGWSTDDVMLQHLTAAGGDVASLQAALVKINDFGSFSSEDEFGRYLETTLSLVPGQPAGASKVFVDQPAPGAGVHNWLLAQFADPTSPIDVADPQTGLSNQRYWAIHGWLDAKWAAFEKVRVRTPLEADLYQLDMMYFTDHMKLHSDAAVVPHITSHPSRALVKELQPILIDNAVACANVVADERVDGCTP
jgi:hypothetical protein